jgi:hypothetical protein
VLLIDLNCVKKHLRGLLEPTTDFYSSIISVIEEVKDQVKLPNEIIYRNPGVSPLAQQKLYEYFQANASRSEELIPELPESFDAVNSSYKELVTVISRYLSGDPEGLAVYQAILIVNWMKGFPLPYLIDNSYRYWENRSPRTYDRVIREVMKDIEEFYTFGWNLVFLRKHRYP